MPDLNPIAWLVGSGGLLAGLGGFWAYLTERRKTTVSAPAEMLRAVTAYDEALNRKAEGLMAGLSGRLATVEARCALLETENEACRAEGLQLRQEILSLEAVLRGQGIQIAPRELPGSLMIIENGKRTVLKPIQTPPDDEPER